VGAGRSDVDGDESGVSLKACVPGVRRGRTHKHGEMWDVHAPVVR
jgi:hypothetical protein